MNPWQTHSSRPNRRSAGFTLVEMMVALTIASILLGIAVPSFMDAIQNSRIRAQYNQIARAFYLARSEAVKSGEFVVVCARSGPTTQECGGDDDWENGALVFVDMNSDFGDAPKVAGDDIVIAVEEALAGDNTITAMARLSSGGSEEKVDHVRYRPAGDANWRGGSIVICDTKRGSKFSKSVNVRLTGDIQRGRPNGATLIPLDAFNAPIDCGSGT